MVSTMSLYIFPISLNIVAQVKHRGIDAQAQFISWQQPAYVLDKLFGADA